MYDSHISEELCLTDVTSVDAIVAGQPPQNEHKQSIQRAQAHQTARKAEAAIQPAQSSRAADAAEMASQQSVS